MVISYLVLVRTVKKKSVGSPEKPLSDLGQISYRSYWSEVILKTLQASRSCNQLSIMDLSKATSIVAEDVVSTLKYLGILKYIKSTHVLTAPDSLLADLLTTHEKKRAPRVNPDLLHWAPVVVSVKRDKWLISSKRKADAGSAASIDLSTI